MMPGDVAWTGQADIGWYNGFHVRPRVTSRGNIVGFGLATSAHIVSTWQQCCLPFAFTHCHAQAGLLTTCMWLTNAESTSCLLNISNRPL